jgi:YD repeat-containing protein
VAQTRGYGAAGMQVVAWADLAYGITEPLGTPGVFNPGIDGVPPTRFTFDVLDRNTSLTRPDNATLTTEYGFGPDRSGTTQFRQVVTDANGHRKATYRDARNQQVALQEFHTPAGGVEQSIWTTYAFDPLKELVEVRDDAGHTTRLSYDNLGRRTSDYAYTATQPHAPSHIGQQTFTYDANGNQTGFTDDTSGQRRTIVWDEENRLQSLSENGHTMTYKYDDGGQRVIKRGPQGETAYVNQWFSIRNGQVGTKNVFVGTARVASKLMKQNLQTFEKDQFFYHTDNLSSTSYVTDTRGRIFEHLEYFPSGETWVQEASNTQRTPFLFAGKELDEETGLYYFGAATTTRAPASGRARTRH